MKCSFLDYVQLLMIGQAISATKVEQNVKKDPLSHQKMKCLFLDYVRLLMISQVILAMKCDRNVKKIGFKNKMTFWFWETLLHVDHSVI